MMMILAALSPDPKDIGMWVIVAMVAAKFIWDWKKDRREEEHVKRAELEKMEARLKDEIEDVTDSVQRLEDHTELRFDKLRLEIRTDQGIIFNKVNEVQQTQAGTSATLEQMERTLRNIDTRVGKLMEEKVNRSELGS